MKALRLESPGAPLRRVTLELPAPAAHQVCIAVEVCGVCRTDLHLLDAELPAIPYPLTPGHEIVGRVVAAEPGATRWPLGARVGVPWLGATCGHCRDCREGRENLEANWEGERPRRFKSPRSGMPAGQRRSDPVLASVRATGDNHSQVKSLYRRVGGT
jgi:D-arabinose 1-dehydrogenase-like Zn-dependent alcohol dehydrogenase